MTLYFFVRLGLRLWLQERKIPAAVPEISTDSEGLQRVWQCTSGRRGTQNKNESCGGGHNQGPGDTAAVQIGYSHLGEESEGTGDGGTGGHSFVLWFKGPPEFQSPPC